MADAVTHARFVGTDPASDEVVLMKILQVQLFYSILLFSSEELGIPSVPRVRICFQEAVDAILKDPFSPKKYDLINNYCLGLLLYFTQ